MWRLPRLMSSLRCRLVSYIRLSRGLKQVGTLQRSGEIKHPEDLLHQIKSRRQVCLVGRCSGTALALGYEQNVKSRYKNDLLSFNFFI